VTVFPGSGKSFDDFRNDDQQCRQFASEQIGGAQASQNANNSALNQAAIATAIGSVAGAAFGGRQGAAVGAGTGLLFGTLQGNASSQSSSYSLQKRYDIGYLQCMYAKGNSVPSVTNPVRVVHVRRKLQASPYVEMPALAYPALMVFRQIIVSQIHLHFRRHLHQVTLHR